MCNKDFFEYWMWIVDDQIQKICGLSHMDLADYMYRDAYDNGESPFLVALAVLEYNGCPLEELS